MKNMMIKVVCFIGIGVMWGSMVAAENQFIQLTGWGVDKPDTVRQAAEIGCTELVSWSQDPAFLARLVAEGQHCGVGIYASLSLNDLKSWKTIHSSQPPPLQVMNAEENQALKRILGDKSPGQSQYQCGGEPCQANEVLAEWDMLCFHHPLVEDLLKNQIKQILAVPGVKGVAFDFFGYRNYRCCRCQTSLDLLAKFHQAHSELSAAQAQERFALDSLVDFNNRLADYAHSLNPKACVMTHVYPVFLPEPLYGNRLKVDVCGQSAAWFYEPYWSLDKIKKYSRLIVEDAGKHYPNAQGAALIGYQRDTSKKTPARVAQELQAIFDGGCQHVQVCSISEVLQEPEIKAVFKKFFKH